MISKRQQIPSGDSVSRFHLETLSQKTLSLSQANIREDSLNSLIRYLSWKNWKEPESRVLCLRQAFFTPILPTNLYSTRKRQILTVKIANLATSLQSWMLNTDATSTPEIRTSMLHMPFVRWFAYQIQSCSASIYWSRAEKWLDFVHCNKTRARYYI